MQGYPLQRARVEVKPPFFNRYLDQNMKINSQFQTKILTDPKQTIPMFKNTQGILISFVRRTIALYFKNKV